MDKLFKTLDKVKDFELRLDILREAIKDFTRNDIDKFLSDYIKYEEKRFSFLLAEKNRLINLGDYDKSNEVKVELKNVKNYTKILRNFSALNFNDEVIEKEEVSVSKKLDNGYELSDKRLLEYYEVCGTDFTNSINSLKQDTLNISLLKDMKRQCVIDGRLLKEISKKARLNNDIELDKKITHVKRTREMLLDYINNLISVYNVTKKKSERQEESYEDVFGKEKALTHEQMYYIDAIINEKDIEIESIVNYAIALKEIIKGYSFVENEDKIIKAIKTITEFPIESTFQDYLYSMILSALKTKRKSCLKEDKYQKRKIDLLSKYLDDQVLYHDNVFINDSTILNYDVLEYAIYRQVPYYYLRQIIKQHKDAILFEKNGKSLLVTILEKYIESAKIELRNHRHDYIKKEYYQNFYHLMLFFMEGEISDYAKEQIDAIATEFREYINLSGYKSENKSNTLTAFERLLNPVDVENYSSFSEEDIRKVQENLKSYTYYLVNSKDRAKQDSDYLNPLKGKILEFQEKFYQDYGKYPNDSFVADVLNIPYSDYLNAYYNLSTVSFDNDDLSFSVLIDDEGSTYFRMNVLDLSSYVSEGDLLNTYLKENMNKNFKNTKGFSKDYSLPSITYQVKIYPNGSIGNLKIFPSVTKLDSKYESLENYRDNHELKKFVSAYKKLSKSTNNVDTTLELEEFFKIYMTNFVKNFCLKEELPVIMRGKKYKDIDVIMKIQSDLGPLFSKMEKGQFLSYYNIFKEELDASHYVSLDYEDGEYYLKLDSPSSYVDLFNQRLLLKLEKLMSDKALLISSGEEACEICDMANKQIGYVQEEKAKVRKKHRKR